MKSIKFLWDHPYIIITTGATLAFVGANECGLLSNACGHNSWQRKSIRLGVYLVILGTVTTVIWAVYKLAIFIKRRK